MEIKVLIEDVIASGSTFSGTFLKGKKCLNPFWDFL
jgi:hypothetical protein